MQVVSTIALGCTRLQYLNLTWCTQVDDVALLTVADNCTQLQLLSLYGIRGVTDISIEALAKSCSKTLSTLDVYGCCNVS